MVCRRSNVKCDVLCGSKSICSGMCISVEKLFNGVENYCTNREIGGISKKE